MAFFAAVSPPLPSTSPPPLPLCRTGATMEASRKTVSSSRLFSQAQAHTVWLLLVSVLLAPSDSMADDKTQLPRKDRALKGREEKVVVAGKQHTGTRSCNRHGGGGMRELTQVTMIRVRASCYPPLTHSSDPVTSMQEVVPEKLTGF